MKDKITVAHVAGGLTTGGVESVVYQYTSHMNPEKYSWIYITYDTPDEMTRKKFENVGFKVYSVTKKKDNLWRSCREVYQILKENHVDIVHSHMTLMCFMTNILGKMAGAGAVISHSHLANRNVGMKRPVYAVFKYLTRWTSKAYFACGCEAGQYLFGKRNMENGKVTVLNNALDYDQFCFKQEKRDRLRKQYGLEGKTIIGHVGRFTEQKNHMFLLKIYEAYKAEHPESVLLLLGDGPLMESVRKEADRRAIKDVLFMGATDQVADWYSAMDVFLFPSLYEGLSVAALEAQISGLSVLAADTVAKETALSPAMKFLPLNQKAEVWAGEMEKLTGVRTGEEMKGILTERNLDIETEALKLDCYYKNVLRR